MDISVYKEFQKMKLYDDAIAGWGKVYNNCQGLKKIIYQDGVKFLRYLIAIEHDDTQKKLLIDSLMHIYDARIKYFGQAAYVKGRKGVDLYRYDKSRVGEVRQILNESVMLRGYKSSPQVLLILMYATERLFNEQKLTKNELSESYSLCIVIMDKQLSTERDEKKIRRIRSLKEAIESSYLSVCDDCNALETVLARRYRADSSNIELIQKIQSVLKSINCVHSDLYYQIALKLNSLQPNAGNSYLLAGFSLKEGQTENAVTYLKEAIRLEKSDSLKAAYYLDLGTIYYTRLKKYKEARDYANEAIKLKVDYGKAFILLGDIYAAFSPLYGKNEFEHAALYWLAVDQYKKAKATDVSLTKIADEKINYYRQQFPTSENAFFYGYSKGQTYKFDDWIKETSEVRFK
jgi:tetratricopeptide (TPR) repeat protein